MISSKDNPLFVGIGGDFKDKKILKFFYNKYVFCFIQVPDFSDRTIEDCSFAAKEEACKLFKSLEQEGFKVENIHYEKWDNLIKV